MLGLYLFLNVRPPKKRAFFWPPSMVYISVIITHTIKNYISSCYRPSVGSFRVLLIFVINLFPLPGFEPRTFRVPSRWLTNEPLCLYRSLRLPMAWKRDWLPLDSKAAQGHLLFLIWFMFVHTTGFLYFVGILEYFYKITIILSSVSTLCLRRNWILC